MRIEPDDDTPQQPTPLRELQRSNRHGLSRRAVQRRLAD
jgi:hypothetical protein